MVYVKMVRNTSGGTMYLKNLCNYVTRAKANDEDDVLGVGGYGINPWNADKAYRQMFAIKLYYNKLEKNPVIHFIISFDRSVEDANTACRYADQIAKFFRNRHQVMWAVHGKERKHSLYHVHLILNSVSYVDGKMYHSTIGVLRQFCNCVGKLTNSKTRLEIEGHTSE